MPGESSPDADADGLPDAWETANGMDPSSPAGTLADVDGDGLSALDEYHAGFDPWDADSNGDGTADGAPPGSDPPIDWIADLLNRAGLRLHLAPGP